MAWGAGISILATSSVNFAIPSPPINPGKSFSAPWTMKTAPSASLMQSSARSMAPSFVFMVLS